VRQLVQFRAARHQPGELLTSDLPLGQGAQAAAAVEHQEAVAHRIGVVRVVGDQHDADPPVPRLRDVPQDDAGLLHAERRRRLVQDQHPGTEVERAGDRHRLPLSPGQRADRLVRVADVDAHGGQLPAGGLPRAGRVESEERPPAPGRLGAEEEVPPDRHQRDRREVLVDRRDPRIERLPRRSERHRLPVEQHVAPVGAVHAGQDLDQRRLARAVVPQHAGDLTGPDRRGDAVEGDHRPVVLADVPELEQRRRLPRRMAPAGHRRAASA
jgi:hypothetical protein